MESTIVGNHQIETGDEFILNRDIIELGEQISQLNNYETEDENETTQPLHKGTKLTVDAIAKYPDGIHINFNTKMGTVTIYKFAFENMLNDEDISLVE